MADEQKSSNLYDKWYKLLLILPVGLMLFSFFNIYDTYAKTGDFIQKDVSLTGGTTITINADVDPIAIEEALKTEFPDVYVRSISDISTGREIALIIGSSAAPEQLQPAIEKFLGYSLNTENSSIEFSGAVLGAEFYKQLIKAIVLSFILMSIVIFFLFRSFVPGIAIILATLGDIAISLAAADFFNIKLSSAGIAAFLMLIGYGVDTNILLTSRVLKKREGTINDRIFSAFKTGMFMTIVGLGALLPAFFIVTGLPDSFRQIFLIAIFGLIADVITTWIGNASIIKWYAHHKKLE